MGRDSFWMTISDSQESQVRTAIEIEEGRFKEIQATTSAGLSTEDREILRQRGNEFAQRFKKKKAFSN